MNPPVVLNQHGLPISHPQIEARLREVLFDLMMSWADARRILKELG